MKIEESPGEESSTKIQFLILETNELRGGQGPRYGLRGNGEKGRRTTGLQKLLTLDKKMGQELLAEINNAK